jgi:hypothetical protein
MRQADSCRKPSNWRKRKQSRKGGAPRGIFIADDLIQSWGLFGCLLHSSGCSPADCLGEGRVRENSIVPDDAIDWKLLQIPGYPESERSRVPDEESSVRRGEKQKNSTRHHVAEIRGMSLSRFCLRITFENSPISILAFLLKFKLKQALRRSCGVSEQTTMF